MHPVVILLPFCFSTFVSIFLVTVSLRCYLKHSSNILVIWCGIFIQFFYCVILVGLMITNWDISTTSRLFCTIQGFLLNYLFIAINALFSFAMLENYLLVLRNQVICPGPMAKKQRRIFMMIALIAPLVSTIAVVAREKTWGTQSIIQPIGFCCFFRVQPSFGTLFWVMIFGSVGVASGALIVQKTFRVRIRLLRVASVTFPKGSIIYLVVTFMAYLLYCLMWVALTIRHSLYAGGFDAKHGIDMRFFSFWNRRPDATISQWKSAPNWSLTLGRHLLSSFTDVTRAELRNSLRSILLAGDLENASSRNLEVSFSSAGNQYKINIDNIFSPHTPNIQKIEILAEKFAALFKNQNQARARCESIEDRDAFLLSPSALGTPPLDRVVDLHDASLLGISLEAFPIDSVRFRFASDSLGFRGNSQFAQVCVEQIFDTLYIEAVVAANIHNFLFSLIGILYFVTFGLSKNNRRLYRAYLQKIRAICKK